VVATASGEVRRIVAPPAGAPGRAHRVQRLRRQRSRLAELKTQVDAAEQALAQAEDEYRAGRATNLERIVAQDQLLSAQLQYTSERYDNRVFYLGLLRACGAMDDVLKGVPTTLPTTLPASQPVAWDFGELSRAASRPRER
jgi:hypothetical protein